MNKSSGVLMLFFALLVFSTVSSAEALSIKADDDISSLLAANKGKRITVKLDSGEELTGTVGEINDEVVQLQELSGKEFFDAVIDTDDISALIIRTKQ